MSNGPRNNATVVADLTKRVNGINKYLKAEKAEVPVQGEMVKPAALTRIYQRSLDARAAVTAGHATYQGALREREAAEEVRLAADESLKAWVLARFGAGSTEATELGFAARKAPTTSAATKAAAVGKREATRNARHTMGKDQKEAITGTTAAPSVPAAPAAAPAPTSTATPATPAPAASTPAVTPAVQPSAAPATHS